MKWGFVAFLLSSSIRVMADPTPPSWDEDRLKGFAEHKNENKIFDREREKGHTAYLEELEKWERERQAARANYKKEKKTSSPSDEGPEYKADQRAKAAVAAEQEEIRQEYVREKEKMLKRRHSNVAVTPAEELGLDVQRPRYDLKKRALYGNAKPSSSTPSRGGGGGYSPGMEEAPPPSNMMPPPPPPPDFENEMPPPPPMPAPSFEDGGGDFPPPPPPPDFSDFPPPPPPPPEGF